MQMDVTKTEPKLIFRTERLYFRTMVQDDFGLLCQILQDEKAMYAYEHAFSDEEVREWLNRQLGRYEEYGFGLWMVHRLDDGEFLGQAGLTMQDGGGRQVLEIGYLFKRAFWHNGYATEAAMGLKEYAFRVLGRDEVYSIIRDSNAASQRVAERNGMEVTGIVLKHYYGMDMPHYMYRVKKKNRKVQMIGGSDGPTAVFAGRPAGRKKKEEFTEFLDRAAASVRPCRKSMEEAASYLADKHGAKPWPLTVRQLQTLKSNVIMNCYEGVLNRPEPLKKGAGENEVRSWFAQDTSFEQAEAYPADRLNLDMRAWLLPDIVQKDGRAVSLAKGEAVSEAGEKTIVEMEMNSGYVSLRSGSEEIMDDLTLFLGVSGEDIEQRSPRFITYAALLRRRGEIC